MTFGVIALIAVLVAVALVYNSLVRLRELAENAWSDIDVQLKRRHDLIPSIVETVRGYSRHEQASFESLTEARARAMAVRGPADRGQAEGELVGALRSVLALAEAYPELRAADGFRKLQDNLVEVEESISQARRYHNAVVRDLNTRIGQVPFNLVAGLWGFRQREFFQASSEERAAPRLGAI